MDWPNVEPFDRAEEAALLAMLPPIPAWWMPVTDVEVDAENVEQVEQPRVRWQDDREFLDRFYSLPERCQEKAVRLQGAAAQLIDLLKSFPMTAFADQRSPPGHDHQLQTVGKGKRGAGRRAQEKLPKRSWIQKDLDEAIREYKAKRANSYNDLVNAVKCGKQGAKESARNLFGRNQLVRALGVKSPAMVTNSMVWQEIADELGLSRGRDRRSHQQRVGLDIALEEQAMRANQPTIDQAIQRETIQLIEKSMPRTEAEATIESLQRGEITDEQARETVKLYVDQKQDDRTRKIRQGL